MWPAPMSRPIGPNSLGNFSVPVNAGAFTSNGLKTVKIFTTDDAGSSGNSVTIQFTLAVTGISAPTPPITPTLELAPYDVTGAPGYTNIPTPNLIGVTTPGATVELLQADGTSFSPPVITTSDPVTGTFTLTFPNPTNQSGIVYRRGGCEQQQWHEPWQRFGYLHHHPLETTSTGKLQSRPERRHGDQG